MEPSVVLLAPEAPQMGQEEPGASMQPSASSVALTPEVAPKGWDPPLDAHAEPTLALVTGPRVQTPGPWAQRHGQPAERRAGRRRGRLSALAGAPWGSFAATGAQATPRLSQYVRGPPGLRFQSPRMALVGSQG